MIDNHTDELKYGYYNENGIYIHTSFSEDIPSIVHAIYGVNISDLGICNIGVIDTERDIPRFHIFTEDDKDIVVMLAESKYMCDNIDLNDIQKESINNAMNLKSIFDNLTVYEDLCSLWNDYNDTEIDFIQPDYRQLSK